MEVDNNENGGSRDVDIELTDQENELYDRQIRLWGLESQKRLRTAKILIAGLSGIGAEVTKNIILSGVNSVKLLDDKIVTEEDFCAQFLVPRSTLGKNRAEASIERAKHLNPIVEISSDTETLDKKDADFFGQFDVVVITGATNKEILRIDEICRQRNIKFFSGDVWGTFGYCFADLQVHNFVEDVVKHKVVSKPNEKVKTELVTTTVQRSLTFPPYSAVLDFDINTKSFQRSVKHNGPAFILLKIVQQFRENFNRDPSYKSRDSDYEELQRIRNELTDESLIPNQYFDYLYSQISPAAAVLGGVLSQEIIKVVSKKEAPNCNIFLFDPQNCCGFIQTIGVN